MDKNFFDDTADWANNLFKMPDVDPTEARREQFKYRQNAIDIQKEWIQTYHTTMDSNEQICYEDLPTINEDIIKAGYTLQLSSNKKNELIIQTTNNGPITEQIKINTGLCIIVDKDETKIKNFKENLIDKYNPEGCSQTSSCANILLEKIGVQIIIDFTKGLDEKTPEFEEYIEDNDKDILKKTGGAVIQIPSPNENKKTSMQLMLIESINNNQEIIINSSTKKLSENTQFKLIKLNDDVCILPIDKSNDDYQTRDGLTYLTAKTLLPDMDYDGLIPKCEKTSYLEEHKDKQINITFASDSFDVAKRTKLLKFKAVRRTNDYIWMIEDKNNLAAEVNEIFKKSQISNYLVELLRTLDYEGGVKKLCDEFPLYKEREINHKENSVTYKITRIDGLRCELITRT